MTTYSVGRHALTTISGLIATVVVENVDSAAGLAHVRRVGTTNGGRKCPPIVRCFKNLRPLATDPLTAQVYADWLDEHGEGAAARKLRAAFPLPEE